MRSGTYKWKGGPEYKVAYNWVGKKGYGFGLECAAFSTDFPEETVTLGYVAPSLVYCQKIDGNCEFWVCLEWCRQRPILGDSSRTKLGSRVYVE